MPGIFTRRQLKYSQSNGNLQIDASLATISNGGNGGLVNIGSQYPRHRRRPHSKQIKEINATTRNVFFDRRFPQNGFASPWYPSTTITSSGSNSAVMTTTIRRTKWFNRTTYEPTFPA